MKYNFKYLRRTKNIFLIFGNKELRLQGYTDLDFMFDIDDQKSIFDSIFFCNGGAVSWKSFKQPVIADSIIKAEYITTSKAAKEVFWFKKFIAELGVMPSDATLSSATTTVP